MATDNQLAAIPGPVKTIKIALPVGSGDAREVLIPGECAAVTLTFKTSAGSDTAGWVAHTGTDGAAKDAGSFPVASGAAYLIRLRPAESLGGSVRSIFLAVDSASALAYLHAEAS
jgi:hypothetical protein